MREHEKQICPTPEQIFERTLSSPRMRKLFEEKGVEIPIPYVIQLPENQPYLTEIDCLKLSTRVRNAVLRSGVRKIALLPQVVSGEQRVRGVGEKFREEIRQSLEDFRQLLNEKYAENPGKSVIIEVSLPPPPKKQTERQASIVDWVKNWQAEHPGRKGSLTAAATHFRITKQHVSQIVAGYEQRTGESLKPEEATSLFELARELGTKSSILLKLLRQGKISFGEKIDPLYIALESPRWFNYYPKVIPISSVNKDELKGQLAEYLSVANVMELLTYATTQRNKDTFFPLSKLARQANMGNPRQLSEIFDELTAAGFHLKKLPGHGGNNFYYYAHKEETEAIVSCLQEKYRAEPKIRLLFGPADTLIPTTTGFLNQFVSVFKVLCEATGLEFHRKLSRKILEIINPTVPIYYYRGRQKKMQIRIRPDHLEALKTQTRAKKEEIIAFLEAHRHKS